MVLHQFCIVAQCIGLPVSIEKHAAPYDTAVYRCSDVAPAFWGPSDLSSMCIALRPRCK